MTDHRPPRDGPAGTDGAFVDLAELQKHALELLAQLERPPCILRIQVGEISVDITWADQTRPAQVGVISTAVAEEADGEALGGYLTSPGVGVFYHAREPGAEPFVAVGSVVRPGEQIGILEAMKLMIPIEADRGGRIAEVLKGDGEPVEYGEPLFVLDVEEV